MSTDQSLVLQRLKDIRMAIRDNKESFGIESEKKQTGPRETKKEPEIPRDKPSRLIVKEVHHYHSPASMGPSLSLGDAMLLSSLRSPNVTVINTGSNESKKEKKTEEKEIEKKFSTGDAMALGAAITVIVGAVTYLLTQDEYVKFYTSELDHKVQVLRELKVLDMKHIQLLNSYDEWKTLFCNRTKAKPFAMGGIGVSTVAVVGGALVGGALGPFVVVVGFVGIAAGGGTLLWKRSRSKKKPSEEEAFKKFYTDLDVLIRAYEQEAEPGGGVQNVQNVDDVDGQQVEGEPSPSAPSPYDDYS
jgi:hypothetical protein